MCTNYNSSILLPGLFLSQIKLQLILNSDHLACVWTFVEVNSFNSWSGDAWRIVVNLSRIPKTELSESVRWILLNIFNVIPTLYTGAGPISSQVVPQLVPYVSPSLSHSPRWVPWNPEFRDLSPANPSRHPPSVTGWQLIKHPQRPWSPLVLI